MITKDLLHTEENPIPPDAYSTFIETSDGVQLRTASWDSRQEPPQGTVLILQGRAEFIEKHFEVIRELQDRGFAVVAFDWRGQGGSQRLVGNPRKGHIRDFSAFHLDVEAITSNILKPYMPPPYYGLAYSMGGAIALDMASRQTLPVERLIAISPMLGINLIKKPALASFTANLCCAFGLGKAFIPFGGSTSISTRPFNRNRLSSDPTRYARISDVANTLGEAAIGAPTIAWTKAAFRLMKKLNRIETLNRIIIPSLIIAGGNDTVCDPGMMERASTHMRNAASVFIPHARHEIYLEQDSYREAFWAAFDAFIPGKLTSPQEIQKASKA
ncbi:alpha/beta hydrolase [Microvirga sp. W0021]|uniref:Alpha/beta hydrolase n=1 Tax=Hohaiivirga grylli TaxID=3133970 RepID=A0ABV0BK73_9HYPH